MFQSLLANIKNDFITTTLIIVVCLVAWLFLLIPSVAYLLTAWKRRFETLKAVLVEDTLEKYFNQFFPSEKDIQKDNSQKFEQLFFGNYGRPRYLPPLILLGIISGLGFIFVANNICSWLKVPTLSALKPVPSIAISAFLGAYMWVAYDQLRRFRMRDFTSHDVYNCSFRFLIAVPLGFSFASIANDNVGITSAFLLGTFPTNTLFKFGKRFISQKLNITGQGQEGPAHELEELQCINREEAERFQAEGKTNILQLAYSDPVDLAIRTNFDFNYVVDCISQALLWLYVGKDIEKVRHLGLRGAQEISVLYRGLSSEKKDEKEIAEGNFREMASALNISENTLKAILSNITEDPYAEFICNIWC